MQHPYSCIPSVYSEIESALSQVRLSRYMAAAGNDKQLALRLYVWNVRLCECFYLPVQFAEVASRNAVMKPVQKRFKDKWYENPAFKHILPPRLEQELNDAIAKEHRKHGGALTGGHVVSALSLGFWVALMSVSYDKHLWANGVKGSFPNAPKDIGREQIYTMLEDMRKLRNDVMHHAALFDRSPKAKLANIMNILGLLSNDARAYVADLDKLSFVINQRPRC